MQIARGSAVAAASTAAWADVIQRNGSPSATAAKVLRRGTEIGVIGARSTQWKSLLPSSYRESGGGASIRSVLFHHGSLDSRLRSAYRSPQVSSRRPLRPLGDR